MNTNKPRIGDACDANSDYRRPARALKDNAEARHKCHVSTPGLRLSGAANDNQRPSSLPASLPPRGIDRVKSAEYIGVSPTKFDEMRADGRISPPKRVDGRIVFDVRKLDKDFDGLPDAQPAETNADNPYD